MNIIEAIVAVAFALLLIRLVWNDGYSSGQSCARRAQIRDANKKVERNLRLIHGLDNRIDGIEARLAGVEVKVTKLERPDANVIYANNEPYAAVYNNGDVESLYKDPRCDKCRNKNEGLVCTACHDGSCYTEMEEAE